MTNDGTKPRRGNNGEGKLPDGWVWTTLGSIAQDISSGFASGRHNQEGVGVPHLRPMNISRDGALDLAVIKSVEAGNFDRLRAGDVLFNNTNSPALLGKTTLIRSDEEWAYSNHMTRIRLAPERVLPGWVAYYLHALFYSGFFKLNARNHVNQSSISRSQLAELPIPIAPLPEQERLVAKIDELQSQLDAGVASLRRVQAALKRYRASVLKAACEGRLVPQDPNDEPASALLARILAERRAKWEADLRAKGKDPKKAKYEEPKGPETEGLPRLPEGWCWATVDQLSVVVRGASPRPAGDPKYFGGTIPWITVGSLTADDSPYLGATKEFVTEAGCRASRYIDSDTLLLTNSGATLGVPKILTIGGCINDGSVALLYVDYPLKLYLYYYLSSITEKLRQINQGAAQPNLNTGIVKAILVPLPPTAVQSNIVTGVERWLSVCKASEQAVGENQKRADRLRQAVLRRAFEGRFLPA